MPDVPKEDTITVTIKNKWLDAMEDWLYCELSEEDTEKCREEMKKLWHTLVENYGKKEGSEAY